MTGLGTLKYSLCHFRAFALALPRGYRSLQRQSGSRCHVMGRLHRCLGGAVVAHAAGLPFQQLSEALAASGLKHRAGLWTSLEPKLLALPRVHQNYQRQSVGAAPAGVGIAWRNPKRAPLLNTNNMLGPGVPDTTKVIKTKGHHLKVITTFQLNRSGNILHPLSDRRRPRLPMPMAVGLGLLQTRRHTRPACFALHKPPAL